MTPEERANTRTFGADDQNRGKREIPGEEIDRPLVLFKPDRPAPGGLGTLNGLYQVRHLSNRQKFDRSSGGIHDGRCDAGRTVPAG